MGLLAKQGMALAQNPELMKKTLRGLRRQISDLEAAGDFLRARELDSMLKNLKLEVAAAKEEMVAGRHLLEKALMDQQKGREMNELVEGLRDEGEMVFHINMRSVDRLEEKHRSERAELEERLHRTVTTQFRATPEMLTMQKQIRRMCAAGEYERADIEARHLEKRMVADKHVFATHLWEQWGEKRNGMAQRQAAEKVRVESDIDFRSQHFDVKSIQDVKHHGNKFNFTNTILDARYRGPTQEARVLKRNQEIRLPDLQPSNADIPVDDHSPRAGGVGASELASQGDVSLIAADAVIHEGWLFKRSGGCRADALGDSSVFGKPAPAAAGPGGRVVKRDLTKHTVPRPTHAVGGAVRHKAQKWERRYAVLRQHQLKLYKTKDAAAANGDEIETIDLQAAELRVPVINDNVTNFQPTKLLFEIVNAMESRSRKAGRKMCVAAFQLDTRVELNEWERQMSKCIRLFGKIETQMRAANKAMAAFGMMGKKKMTMQAAALLIQRAYRRRIAKRQEERRAAPANPDDDMYLGTTTAYAEEAATMGRFGAAQIAPRSLAALNTKHYEAAGGHKMHGESLVLDVGGRNSALSFRPQWH